jgi:dTDP-4-dehydrorhamnose reductase
MKVLVTGSIGQLGSEIRNISNDYKQFDFYFTNRDSLNICDYSDVKNFVESNKIEAIINCAAYTQVDKAENDRENAFTVNSTGVSNLVQVSEEHNVKLIHVSTDYVFDGTNHSPYKETDATTPLGVYGSSKLAGENFLINSSVNGVVIRTSWLYSQFGANFVKTMMRLGRERDSLDVISDQIGSPTNARDLAVSCLEILSKNKKLNTNGHIYHFSNEGVASWFDFARAIMNLSGISCRVNPIETKDYPTPAKRPSYSVLNKSKIKKDFKIEIPYWRDSLKDCIGNLIK